MVGVGLAIRTQRTVGDGDVQALQTVEQRLVQELKRSDTIRDAATKIRRQVETIEKEVSVGETTPVGTDPPPWPPDLAGRVLI